MMLSPTNYENYPPRTRRGHFLLINYNPLLIPFSELNITNIRAPCLGSFNFFDAFIIIADFEKSTSYISTSVSFFSAYAHHVQLTFIPIKLASQ